MRRSAARRLKKRRFTREMGDPTERKLDDREIASYEKSLMANVIQLDAVTQLLNHPPPILPVVGDYI